MYFSLDKQIHKGNEGQERVGMTLFESNHGRLKPKGHQNALNLEIIRIIYLFYFSIHSLVYMNAQPASGFQESCWLDNLSLSLENAFIM